MNQIYDLWVFICLFNYFFFVFKIDFGEEEKGGKKT